MRDTVELTLQEVFDEVCPSEEEEGELWPDDGVEGWGGMEVDGFLKLGGTGKRKGNGGRDASSAPPPKKAYKSSKDQVNELLFCSSYLLFLVCCRSRRNAPSAKKSSVRSAFGDTTGLSFDYNITFHGPSKDTVAF